MSTIGTLKSLSCTPLLAILLNTGAWAAEAAADAPLEYGYCEVSAWTDARYVDDTGKSETVTKIFFTRVMDSRIFGGKYASSILPSRYEDDWVAHVNSIKAPSDRLKTRFNRVEPDCTWHKTKEAAEADLTRRLAWRGHVPGSFTTQATNYVFPAHPTGKPPAPAKTDGGLGIIVAGPSKEDRAREAKAKQDAENVAAKRAAEKARVDKLNADAKAKVAKETAEAKASRQKMLADVKAAKEACAAGDKTQCGSRTTRQ